MLNAVWRGGSSALRGRCGRGLSCVQPTTAGEAGRQPAATGVGVPRRTGQIIGWRLICIPAKIISMG